jgi:two-component system CheB/CheR fusion protein
LFLGTAERLLSHRTLFQPTDLKQRMFRKVLRAHVPEHGFYTDGAHLPVRSGAAGRDALRAEAMLALPLP